MVKKMNRTRRKTRGSEGSSLAIALFFFLLCSLMCAGMLYLANTSSRSVSQSLNKFQEFVEPETPPVIGPSGNLAKDAVQIVYDSIKSDFEMISQNHNDRDVSYINGTNNPIVYAIFTDLWRYGEWNNGRREYTVQLEGTSYPPVTVQITATSYHNWGVYFSAKKFNVVVSAEGAETQSFTIQTKSGQYDIRKDILLIFGDRFKIT